MRNNYLAAELPSSGAPPGALSSTSGRPSANELFTYTDIETLTGNNKSPQHRSVEFEASCGYTGSCFS
jgi:hypothetical protein